MNCTVYQVALLSAALFLSLAAVPTWLFVVFSSVGVASCQIENVIC